MGVVFRFHGQAEVKDVANGWHIDTTGGDISGYQDLNLALTQSHQAAITQALAQGTVQGNRREAFLLQVIGQAIALNLCTGKNNGLIDGGVTQPMVEQLALVLCVIRPKQCLLDVGVFFLRGIDLDSLRFAHDA